MTNLTNRLLSKAYRIAVEHSDMQSYLTKAFERRYGCTYSDVDADWLIDALDYGSGKPVTVEDCDRLMAEAGRPALPSQERA